MLGPPVRLVVLLALLAVACTPASETPTTTAPATSTSVTSPPSTSTSTSTSTSIPEDDLKPPETGDPDDVAADAFWGAGTFRLVDDEDLFDEAALRGIERWLPERLVEGLVWEMFTDDDQTSVLVVSVIPALQWRGDPTFLSALVTSRSGVAPTGVEDGIYHAEAPDGLAIHVWSTGDGFIVATSPDPDRAVAYLIALAAETGPQPVWEKGSCLYIDPETEALPYAPFPPDIVVPCSGPHNAEVIESLQVGTGLNQYDEDVVEYERNYVCDRAYSETFGPQKDHTPSLITYMPDSDEWDRGDRYLTCVVQINTLNGPLLVAGHMADRTDLAWSPEPGECFDRTFAPESVSCAVPHAYQYIGNAEVHFDAWPDDGRSAFHDACVEILDSFAKQGPVEIDVTPTGLFPFAFEEGDRSVRCMAFAIEDGALTNVIGAFDETWRTIGSGGIST
ncbi:MAG: septum formation family protein [Actinomycetota bacterium]|nr:septum formation family protein [Actinomycetota bacterium]